MALGRTFVYRSNEKVPKEEAMVSEKILGFAAESLTQAVESLEAGDGDKGIRVAEDKKNPNIKANKEKRGKFALATADVLTSIFSAYNSDKDKKWQDVFRQQANDYLTTAGLHRTLVPLYQKIMVLQGAEAGKDILALIEEVYKHVLGNAEKIFYTPKFFGVSPEEYHQIMEEIAIRRGEIRQELGNLDLEPQDVAQLKGLTPKRWTELLRQKDPDADQGPEAATGS